MGRRATQAVRKTAMAAGAAFRPTVIEGMHVMDALGQRGAADLAMWPIAEQGA